MSLRFDRKASSKLRASFSCRSRTEKERDEAAGKDQSQKEYLKSWSYRQCQFACDYLNLIESPTQAHLVRNLKTELVGIGKQNKEETVQSSSSASSLRDNNGIGGGGGDAVDSSILRTNSSNPNESSGTSGIKTSKLSGNMSSASLGSTLSIPASCVTTSSRSSFNSSILSTASSASSNHSSDSSSSCGGGSGSLYADLFELGYGSSSLLFRDMGTMKPADPFRFSQATLEDTQEDELNAILGELSALQMSLDREISHQPGLLQVPGVENNKPSSAPQTQSDNGVRTESPDNDSGFSDNASLLSSGSSLSASGSSSGSSTASCGAKIATNLPHSNVLHATELAEFVSSKLQKLDTGVPDEKAEKIRVALEKMRAASVTRLYVKAFTQDGSSKALMVEESMTCGRVLALLADKNHVQLSQKWTLVEHLPHLHMERIYEDHENMVENLLMWTRDSKNKILFLEKDEKYDMFVNPQKYFLESRVSHSGGCMDEHTKNGLIEEFFAHGVGVPEVESFLYLKAEGKKAWKKFPFVLRASGIYYCPKGRTHANASKDLICLATIDHNIQAYQGIGWKKKFKSPTEFGFALKPARLQVKSHRHMKYLCAEDADTLRLWMVGIRIAKYGKQLWDNYRSLMEDLAHEDLDRFGRSVSLASMPQQMNNPIIISTANKNAINKSPVRRYSQESYQSASSIQSYAIPNSAVDANMPPPPPLSKEEGFESDCPMGGTIKRKPSNALTPKIPLTVNTRSIVGEFINITNGAPGEGSTVTLQRKRSLSGNSSSSSSSSMVSQIHVSTKEQNATPFQRNPPPVVPAKPTGGTLVRSQPLPPVEPVMEESMDSLDMENLPPPPPELLHSESESSNSPSPDPAPFPPPPPPPVNHVVMNSTTPSHVNIMSNNTIITNSCLKSSIPANNTGTVKRGVSFATELSERLKSRADNSTISKVPSDTNTSNGGECVYGEISNNKVNGQKRVGFNLCDASSQPPSSPKKLEEPPEYFLKDLQRVMQKKWQVAQKCHADKNTTPHEILGFRTEPAGDAAELPPPMPVMEDLNVKQLPPSNGVMGGGIPMNGGFPPAPPSCQSAMPSPAVINSNLNNVEAWVSQHYGTMTIGNTMGKIPNTAVHNLANNRPSPPPVGQKPVPPQRAVSYTSSVSSTGTPSNNAIYQQTNNIPLSHNNSSSNSVVIYENFEGRKSCMGSAQYPGVELRQKRPPPPVPKRAESTHLSAHIVFN